ncbi:MAG: adenylate/guanylate cyclase domain-containing protein [Nitrososphaeraceae archaeon]
MTDNLKTIIIPQFLDNPGKKYFNPRFVNIFVGQSIRWLNVDHKQHNLIFDREIDPYGAEIGLLDPLQSLTKDFDTFIPRIDYRCSLHPNEHGTIIMSQNNEKQIYKTKKSNRNGFPINEEIQNRSKDISIPNIGKPIFEDVEPNHITLQRFLDPRIYSSLKNPNLYLLQSKKLTIVFWDIHGFSTLCNKLEKEPVTVVGFLREYFDLATKIIHNNSGVVDKFIGDGIMSYFGFENNLDSSEDIFQAINSALDLRKSFEGIKKKWVGIWERDFNHKNIDINLKCGIHTGDVLFGLIDTGTRSQITIIGKTVNYASRLEGKADNNQIIISKEVNQKIHDHYKTSSIPITNEDRDIKKSFPNITEVYELIED